MKFKRVFFGQYKKWLVLMQQFSLLFYCYFFPNENQTMNKVFEHAGDIVNPRVAHNLMRLIAEGFGEDDEGADTQLRSSAVCNLLDLLVMISFKQFIYSLDIILQSCKNITHGNTTRASNDC
jgi:hypothetical protein